MPDTRDLSKFLKAKDLNDGDILTFTNAGEIGEVDFSKSKDGSKTKTVLQIGVELDGKDKVMTLNKTSQNCIEQKYGTLTENWVGKKVQVNFIEQLCFGELTDVLVLKPTE